MITKRSYIFNQNICSTYTHNIINQNTCDQKFLFIADNSVIMGDEEDRKLFVGGLPQEASQDDLQVNFIFIFER